MGIFLGGLALGWSVVIAASPSPDSWASISITSPPSWFTSAGTLLMLVSAFAGYERVMAAYRHAVAARYRFFSYGDAMFLEPEA